MTEAVFQRATTDQASISPPESLVQENTRLRQQLADRQDQLTALHAKMDQLVDERLVELATLQDIDLQIYARLEAEHVMHAVLDWAMLVTAAVAGTLYLLVESDQPAHEQKMLRAVAQRGYLPHIEEHERQPWPLGHDILSHALKTGQTVRQSHVDQEITRASPQDQPRAHLAIPILHQDAPIGILGLESAFADGFTAAQIDSADRLADHAALAIQNALHHRQTHQRLDELLAVHTSCLRLTSHLDLDTLPEQIVHYALDVLSADRAALYWYDRAAEKLALAAALDRDGKPCPETDPSEGTLTEAADQDHKAHWALDPAAGEMAALPLTSGDLPTGAAQTGQTHQGILYLFFKTRGHLFEEKSVTIQRFADYAASALQNARQVARHRQALEIYQDRQSQIVEQSRAPLTSIRGYAKLMLQQIGGQITDQQRDFVQTILKNAHHLEALIGRHTAP
jgi:hypothetical protein